MSEGNDSSGSCNDKSVSFTMHPQRFGIIVVDDMQFKVFNREDAIETVTELLKKEYITQDDFIVLVRQIAESQLFDKEEILIAVQLSVLMASTSGNLLTLTGEGGKLEISVSQEYYNLSLFSLSILSDCSLN